MTLKLWFATCLVCNRDLHEASDEANIDRLDEEGNRIHAYTDYVLPPENLRRRIAPDLCDACWIAHRSYTISAYQRQRWAWGSPTFRSGYLWSWVMDQLERGVTELSREARKMIPRAREERLTVHLVTKANAAKGIVVKGSDREYGPRRVVYRRGAWL